MGMKSFIMITKSIFSLLLILFLGNINVAFSQKGMTFQQAKDAELFNELDSLYHGGIDSDSTKSVFKDQEAYIKAYQQFMLDAGNFLAKNNFKWGKQVRCFNKIYFSKEGKVDYFLYNFREGQITPEQEQEFARLIQLFIQQAKFGLEGEMPFSQCSPVVYND
jgi:hypothetical protein